MYSKLSISFGLLASAALALADSTVYLIRHGEKPSNGGTGLSSVGSERAQCLTHVFGPDSDYNIGYIIAEQPKSGMSPIATALSHGQTLTEACRWQAGSPL